MPKTETQPKNTKSGVKKPQRPKKSKKTKKRSTVKQQMKPFIFRFHKPSRRIGTGGVMPKSEALGRLIRWPKYVKLQRQKKVLLQRLKVPPALNIFNQTANKKLATSLIKLFDHYKPESRSQRLDRLRKQANTQTENKVLDSTKPILVKYGFNHVTNLIEKGSAKLVLIAHDVDPIELVLWMPTLCVKRDIPFAIVKGKSRLGTLVRKKTAACVALCDVSPEHQELFKELTEEVKSKFNKQFNLMKRKWSGRVLGIKTRHKLEKRQRIKKEEAKRRKEAQDKSGKN